MVYSIEKNKTDSEGKTESGGDPFMNDNAFQVAVRDRIILFRISDDETKELMTFDASR